MQKLANKRFHVYDRNSTPEKSNASRVQRMVQAPLGPKGRESIWYSAGLCGVSMEVYDFGLDNGLTGPGESGGHVSATCPLEQSLKAAVT